MSLINQGSAECIASEVELFSLPATDTSYADSPRYHLEQPVTSIGSGSTIDFLIKSSPESYIDLKNSYIDITLSINDSSGSPIAAPTNTTTDAVKAAKVVFPEQYLVGALFKNVEFYINSTLVSSADNLYPYRAIIETILTTNRDVKNEALRMSLWFPEPGNSDALEFRDGSKLATLDAETDGITNLSSLSRFMATKHSTKFQLIGRIHCDLFNQIKYLPGKNELRLKFFRHNPEFSLRRSTQSTSSYTIKIDRMNLMVKKCEVSPHLREEHEKRLISLKNESMKFAYENIQMKEFIHSGRSRHIQEPNLVNGILPSKLIIGLVDTDAVNGSFEKNPFNFQNCDATNVVLRKNGIAVPYDQISLDFTNDNYFSGYYSLLKTMGCNLWGTESLGITAEQYKYGNCFFGFDLTNDSNNGCLPLIESGKLSLDIKLGASAPTGSITVIAYMLFDSVLHIAADGQVSLSNKEGLP